MKIYTTPTHIYNSYLTVVSYKVDTMARVDVRGTEITLLNPHSLKVEVIIFIFLLNLVIILHYQCNNNLVRGYM